MEIDKLSDTLLKMALLVSKDATLEQANATNDTSAQVYIKFNDFDDELTFDKIISAVDYTIHSGNNYSDKTMLMDVYDEFTLLPPDAPRNLSVDQLERNLQLSCDTIHKAASLFKTYAENDSYELYSYSKNGDDKVSKVEITLCT